MYEVILIEYSTSIDKLKMSVRSTNALRRANIFTVLDLMNISDEDLPQIKNIGAKSVDEIREVRKNIQDGLGFKLVDNIEFKKISEEALKEDTRSNSEKYPELIIPIEELHLSVRAYNALKNAGINQIVEICDLTEEELMHMKNMGKLSAESIIEKLKTNGYHREKSNTFQSAWAYDEDIAAIVKSFENSKIEPSKVNLIKNLFEIRKQYPDVHHESFTFLAYQNPYIISIINGYILDRIDNYGGSLPKYVLEKELPDNLRNTTIIKKILVELKNKGEIQIDEDVILRDYPSIYLFTSELNDRNKDILNRRLNGETLESIAQDYNVTRERVRQISNKILAKRPRRVKEDKLRDIYFRYDLNPRDFNRIFKQKDYVGYYLEMIRDGKISRKPLSEILEDEQISKEHRLLAEKEIYSNYLVSDDTYIPNTIASVALYVLRHAGGENLTPEQITKKIHDVFIQNGKVDTNETNDLNHTALNRLAESEHVLHSGKYYRYYNLDNYDLAALYDELNLENYEDVELSAAAIFNNNASLMSEYDIRNYNELHNLLKKTIHKYRPDISVDFSRNPTIVFGNGNRDEQMFNLLLENAPISQNDLADKYVEIYGVNKATVLANFFSSVKDYMNSKGILDIEQEAMSDEEIKVLENLLDEDFYIYDEIRSIYSKSIANANLKYINAYNIRRMHFKPYSSYAIRDSYDSARSFFIHALTDKDTVNTSSWKRKYFNQEYNTTLNELLENYEIVEYLPKQYINIRRLKQVGITKEIIINFCEKVAEYMSRDTYFTIRSLRNEGMLGDFDEYGLEDYFYSSILRSYKKLFASQKLGGGILIKKSTNHTSTEEFILQVINENGRPYMEIFDLIDQVQNHYGINLEKNRIIHAIEDTDLYYDKIMETIYLDYETYFMEV